MWRHIYLSKFFVKCKIENIHHLHHFRKLKIIVNLEQEVKIKITSYEACQLHINS